MFGRGLGDTYAVFLLPLESEYGWTRSQLTSVYSIYLLMHGFTSPLVGLVFDRRFAYRVLGGMLLVLVPIVAFLIPWRRFYAGHPEQRHAAKLTPGEEGWTLREAMRSPLYWGLCQVFFCTATAMFTVIVQLVAFFVDVGFSPIAAAGAYGALGLMSAASVMGSGITADPFGYRPTITVTL